MVEKEMPTLKLHYILDPMCSWCYGFSRTMDTVLSQLPDNISLHYVMGGLAPDSNEPMPQEMQQYVQNAWKAVSKRTGAEVNFDFWTRCRPKRSTYPSCRAVIAAGLQNREQIPAMIKAIQTAYYRQARNPSNNDTLIQLAGEIGLNPDQFTADLTSNRVEHLLLADFNFKNRLGVQGFPTLILEKEEKFYALTIGYAEPEIILERLKIVMERP